MVHIRILIATDFHLGYRQYGLHEREEDFYRQFNCLVDSVIQENPDLFIELGDVFDEPYPKPKAIKVFRDGIQKISDAGIPIIGVIGNHTLVHRKKFYPIDRLFEEKIVLLNGDSLIFDNVWIGGLRYSSKLNNIKEQIDSMYEVAKNYKTKILLLHQGLKQIVPIGWDMDLEEMELDRFDYVLCGHIHQRYTMKIKNTTYHYPGSLNSCSVTDFIDEEEQGKGYTILDIENQTLKIKNLQNGRPFLDLNLTDDDLNENNIKCINESLKEYKIKPILRVKSETKEPLNVYKACEIWENNTLFINKKINKITEILKIKEDEKMLSVDELIKKTVDEKYGKNSWQGEFAVELKNKLLQDKESGKEYADKIYKEKFKNGTGVH